MDKDEFVTKMQELFAQDQSTGAQHLRDALARRPDPMTARFGGADGATLQRIQGLLDIDDSVLGAPLTDAEKTECVEEAGGIVIETHSMDAFTDLPGRMELLPAVDTDGGTLLALTVERNTWGHERDDRECVQDYMNTGIPTVAAVHLTAEQFHELLIFATKVFLGVDLPSVNE